MRAKVVHTSLDCSVFLHKRSRSGHSGNSRREQESKVALFLMVVVSATFSLNLAKTKDSHAKCCSITVLPFAANVMHSTHK